MLDFYLTIRYYNTCAKERHEKNIGNAIVA